MTTPAKPLSNRAEMFARLAREELQRGAVWMAEMAALLALQADGQHPSLVELLEQTQQARRSAHGGR